MGKCPGSKTLRTFGFVDQPYSRRTTILLPPAVPYLGTDGDSPQDILIALGHNFSVPYRPHDIRKQVEAKLILFFFVCSF